MSGLRANRSWNPLLTGGTVSAIGDFVFDTAAGQLVFIVGGLGSIPLLKAAPDGEPAQTARRNRAANAP